MGNAVVHFELMSKPDRPGPWPGDPEGRMMGLWKAKQ
jgi:hypothetical protein